MWMAWVRSSILLLWFSGSSLQCSLFFSQTFVQFVFSSNYIALKLILLTNACPWHIYILLLDDTAPFCTSGLEALTFLSVHHGCVQLMLACLYCASNMEELTTLVSPHERRAWLEIFITFSASIICCYCLQLRKRKWNEMHKSYGIIKI